MGFRSSLAIAQTTRFKRTLYSSQSRSSHPFTPPATPFNNTSFLIQLQQRREQFGRSAPRRLRFDQYGSMEKMIACCSFAATPPPQTPNPKAPIPPPSTSQSSNSSISHTSDCSHGGQLTSDPDESQLCDSCPELNSCGSDAGSAMRPTLEAGERDGVLKHRRCHRQNFMDDNLDTQFCADSCSQTATSLKT